MKSLIERVPVCEHGIPGNISVELLRWLTLFEAEFRLPVNYSSGYRCATCNMAVGGRRGSRHLEGLAVDIACNVSRDRYDLLSALFAVKFPRIGVALDHIHVDIDGLKSGQLFWLE